MSFLEIKNLTKSYPKSKKPALNGLAFSMKKGEILSFVGPSGSGKSTLLKLIGGLISQDSGEILFKGKTLTKPEDQLIAGEPGVKMVFQDLKLMPNHTVEENIKYPLLIYNNDYQNDRAEELLTICGLLEFRKRMPRELSGGQQQRLALAKTLAQDPELLLMDEPFSNLDPIVKKHLIFEVIEIVRSQQLSLIFVTHDTKDALMISDRIGMIHQGEIIAMDSPRAIYAKPSRLIVAEFFGTVNTFSQTEFEKIFGKTLPSKLREAEQLAIRAEAFSSDSGRNGYKIKGQIVDRKFLGSTVLLIVMIKDKKIEIELPANDQNLELEEFFINPESIMQLEP